VDYVLLSLGFRANNALGKDDLDLLFKNGPYKVIFNIFKVIFICILFD
jgi:hypothetical protein